MPRPLKIRAEELYEDAIAVTTLDRLYLIILGLQQRVYFANDIIRKRLNI